MATKRSIERQEVRTEIARAHELRAVRLQAKLQRLADIGRGPTISFPDWVIPPTPCKTRTFTFVLAGYECVQRNWHGAQRFENTFPNEPMEIRPRRNGAPGVYLAWVK